MKQLAGILYVPAFAVYCYFIFSKWPFAAFVAAQSVVTLCLLRGAYISALLILIGWGPPLFMWIMQQADGSAKLSN